MFPPCSIDNIFITKKYLEQNSLKIVDHILAEISTVTKFSLDMGASKNAELFWRSWLLQDGLKIRYKIIIKTHYSFNMEVFKRCKDIVDELHIKPMEKTVTIILGGNYTDKFAQELRRRKRSINIYVLL